ncbi:hypothetical protein [Alteromonas oceanisediminis]|uniref:hypothetical protein n=1 Tax=Alteromonas oceanisediminis TaxID=2836180 RepID=UPI001BDA82FA|nr:hypothetical protein [Alteromonas oceanisediminis]MBT0586757.1 hypothetical protein [Alteromonas oceanisediminis]
MNTHTLKHGGAVLKFFHLVICLLLTLFSYEIGAQQVDTYVIAHPAVTQASVSERQLRRIFMLKQRTWDSGEPISLIVFSSDNNKHSQFLKQTLKLFPYQLEREWNKLIYSGQSAPPMIATSTQNMLKLVSNTPGAIGYIVSSAPDQAVKIIEVTNE